MADLPVVRRGPTIWPWVLGLAALVLVIWLVAETFGDDGAVVVGETSVTFEAPAAYHLVGPSAA